MIPQWRSPGHKIRCDPFFTVLYYYIVLYDKWHSFRALYCEFITTVWYSILIMRKTVMFNCLGSDPFGSFCFVFFMAVSVAYGSSWAGSNQSCSCQPTPQNGVGILYRTGIQECRIWAASVTCAAACSNAGSLTHWAGPELEPASSWILAGLTC